VTSLDRDVATGASPNVCGNDHGPNVLDLCFDSKKLFPETAVGGFFVVLIFVILTVAVGSGLILIAITVRVLVFAVRVLVGEVVCSFFVANCCTKPDKFGDGFGVVIGFKNLTCKDFTGGLKPVFFSSVRRRGSTFFLVVICGDLNVGI